ncbi:MAG TPA: SPASM domain-containing protein, partial [Polyangiaceae bacterium]|nr:SPASM domain-containing protein [Polyangiaceae bacterium]
AGCRVVALGANGDVKGCPSHPREFVVGNVRETPLAALWADARRFAYNTAFREELLEGACAECAYRKVCRAGCTSMAYAVTGTIYDNPFCLQRATEVATRRRRNVIESARHDP